MILKKRWHILLLLLSICYTAPLIAQQTTKTDKVLKQLTKEQQEMLAEQQLFIDKSKKEFKNSLTAEQRKILLDKSIPRSDKSKLLRKSLSKKQRALLAVNKNRLRDRQLKFKRSLTRKQMIRLRRFANDRAIHDRKRLLRRLRRLIRDNLNTDN